MIEDTVVQKGSVMDSYEKLYVYMCMLVWLVTVSNIRHRDTRVLVMATSN
jgi:hypothetical protein